MTALESSLHLLETKPPTNTYNQLRRDFYFTFRFSQGCQSLQEYLTEALGLYYQTHFTNSEELSRLSRSTSFRKDLTAMRIPRSHIHNQTNTDMRIRPEEIESEFKIHATNFLGFLGRASTAEIVEDSKLMKKICDLTMDRDVNFLRPLGQGRGYLAFDRKSSYFREYILCHQPTSSESFNTVFADASDYFQASGQEQVPGFRLRYLIEVWGNHHPGEQFYPSDIAQESHSL